MGLPCQVAKDWTSRRARLGVTLFMLLGPAAGCGSRRATGDYVPEPDRARQAVEQMLEAWRTGAAVASSLQLPQSGPHLQVFDKQRASGKKLTRYEVVRELPAEPNRPRQLAVRLAFGNDPELVEATYYVVGIDPILIFRDTEYNQASGMNK